MWATACREKSNLLPYSQKGMGGGSKIWSVIARMTGNEQQSWRWCWMTGCQRIYSDMVRIPLGEDERLLTPKSMRTT